MFSKILAALNTNAIGQQIFEHALTLATARNAELLLLHVISPFDDGYLDASNSSLPRMLPIKPLLNPT